MPISVTVKHQNILPFDIMSFAFSFNQFPNIPMFAMLRPHNRASHRVSDFDMEIVMSDLEALKEAGADGFVFGALNYDRTIDEESCQRVLQAAGNLPVTFHRAFDMTYPPHSRQNLERIARMGFKRVLTSGFSESADLGVDELLDMNNCIRDEALDLILVPGCGVTVDNIEDILLGTECKEIHASGKATYQDQIPKMPDGDTFAIEQAIDRNSHYVSDVDFVRELVLISRAVAVDP